MLFCRKTNTKKIIHAYFALDDGKAAVDGDITIPGVSGTVAPVRLEFLSPGGATTGRLLPTVAGASAAKSMVWAVPTAVCWRTATWAAAGAASVLPNASVARL